MRTPSPHIHDLIETRLSRRRMLGGLAATPFLSLAQSCATPAMRTPGLLPGAAPAFDSIAATRADIVSVPAGYTARTLIAWGDTLFESATAPFDPGTVTRAEQEMRWGQNNDMLALFPATYAFPFPREGARFLLCANHEYVEPSLVFPGVAQLQDFTQAQAQAMLAAIGCSVVELVRDSDGWRVVKDAAPGAGRTRRITAFSPMAMDGPAAHHRWIAAAGVKFREAEPGAPEGAIPCGTQSNCAGGQTPWGTYLTAEENINYLFHMSDPATPALAEARADAAWASGAPNFSIPLERGRPNPAMPPQFDVSTNPYGPSVYGWVVEIDPYDPHWIPRKRTALGRRKGEGATTALTRNGRVAVYSGDDQADEFVYKFISAGRFDPADREANRDLLSTGALYTARLDEDGTGEWVALTLAAANAAAAQAGIPPFTDEGEVMIRAREAARALGATPMDRPEDIEPVLDSQWVGLGPVLIACTNNSRAEREARPGNPNRESADGALAQPNLAGHILRFDEADGDCGATRFRWDIFALGGDPDAGAEAVTTPSGRAAQVSVQRNGAPANTGARFACPDNLCIDAAYNVWVGTDGSDGVFGDCNDCVVVMPAEGARTVKRFLVGPRGCEVCGPMLSFDQRTFFAAIQHPGEQDLQGRDFSRSRWQDPDARPGSSFPDGNGAWPRSAVVTVTKDDGGIIGS